MSTIAEMVWQLFRRIQVYASDIPSVKVDFGEIGIHRIEPMSVQFPAKYSLGTAELRMLPIIPCWSSTVHKMQGSTVDKTVVYLGSKLFAPGQAYVALSRVRWFDDLRFEEFECSMIILKNVCNEKKTIKEMERLRHL